MDDSKIIDYFFARSEQAIEALSAKYGRICSHTALNILGNDEDAKECVNDAYLAVWNAIPPTKPNSLLSFLLRIVRNISINRRERDHAIKRSGNYQECIDELHWCLSGSETPEEVYDAKLLTGYINEFLSGLSKTDRLIFLRRYWYLDSYADLSSATGLRQGTIRTRLSRLREKLKLYLSERNVML